MSPIGELTSTSFEMTVALYIHFVMGDMSVDRESVRTKIYKRVNFF